MIPPGLTPPPPASLLPPTHPHPTPPHRGAPWQAEVSPSSHRGSPWRYRKPFPRGRVPASASLETHYPPVRKHPLQTPAFFLSFFPQKILPFHPNPPRKRRLPLTLSTHFPHNTITVREGLVWEASHPEAPGRPWTESGADCVAGLLNRESPRGTPQSAPQSSPVCG